VVVINILYNYEADIMYCILDAPHKEALGAQAGKVKIGEVVRVGGFK